MVDQALGGDVPMCPCGAGGSPHTAALQSRSPKEAPPTCAWLELLRRAGGGVTVTEVVAEARPMKLK